MNSSWSMHMLMHWESGNGTIVAKTLPDDEAKG